MPKQYKRSATFEEVVEWFNRGCFQVIDDKIYRGEKEIKPHACKRRGMETGDARVGLWQDGLRKNLNISQAVWMWNTRCPIPDGFEIHHLDEDANNNNFSNLVLLHSLDHHKFHYNTPEDEVPF